MARTTNARLYTIAPPEPPESLSDASKAVWHGVVRQYPGDHFNVADQVLLEQFCAAYETVEVCNAGIARDGLVVDSPQGVKPNPLVGIKDREVRNMAMLASKLRLPVSSRIRSELAATRPAQGIARPWLDSDGLIALPDYQEQ